ncbi:hypothetical protein CCUS01_10255 [Colletotrichum cuscutae]|uniref:Uncharacterized protein n=1 Tax=Colletotrichum cuscutae TaxID=1209917 RepID=A0AAI9UD12_9PEZI|nr:hypothetical protein CCUS01_10255 [Colletotrichum cuscutae]
MRASTKRNIFSDICLWEKVNYTAKVEERGARNGRKKALAQGGRKKRRQPTHVDPAPGVSFLEVAQTRPKAMIETWHRAGIRHKRHGSGEAPSQQRRGRGQIKVEKQNDMLVSELGFVQKQWLKARFGKTTLHGEDYNSAIWHQHNDNGRILLRPGVLESPSWQARMHEAGKDTHLPYVLRRLMANFLLGVSMLSWNLDAEFDHDNLSVVQGPEVTLGSPSHLTAEGGACLATGLGRVDHAWLDSFHGRDFSTSLFRQNLARISTGGLQDEKKGVCLLAEYGLKAAYRKLLRSTEAICLGSLISSRESIETTLLYGYKERSRCICKDPPPLMLYCISGKCWGRGVSHPRSTFFFLHLLRYCIVILSFPHAPSIITTSPTHPPPSPPSAPPSPSMAFRSVLHDSIPSTAPFDTDPSFQATNGPLHWAAYTWWRNPPTDNCFPQTRLYLEEENINAKNLPSSRHSRLGTGAAPWRDALLDFIFGTSQAIADFCQPANKRPLVFLLNDAICTDGFKTSVRNGALRSFDRQPTFGSFHTTRAALLEREPKAGICLCTPMWPLTTASTVMPSPHHDLATLADLSPDHQKPTAASTDEVLCGSKDFFNVLTMGLAIHDWWDFMGWQNASALMQYNYRNTEAPPTDRGWILEPQLTALPEDEVHLNLFMIAPLQSGDLYAAVFTQSFAPYDLVRPDDIKNPTSKLSTWFAERRMLTALKGWSKATFFCLPPRTKRNADQNLADEDAATSVVVCRRVSATAPLGFITKTSETAKDRRVRRRTSLTSLGKHKPVHSGCLLKDSDLRTSFSGSTYDGEEKQMKDNVSLFSTWSSKSCGETILADMEPGRANFFEKRQRRVSRYFTMMTPRLSSRYAHLYTEQRGIHPYPGILDSPRYAPGTCSWHAGLTGYVIAQLLQLQVCKGPISLRKIFLFTVSLPTHTLSTIHRPAVGRLASYTSNICRSQPLLIWVHLFDPASFPYGAPNPAFTAPQLVCHLHAGRIVGRNVMLNIGVLAHDLTKRRLVSRGAVSPV